MVYPAVNELQALREDVVMPHNLLLTAVVLMASLMPSFLCAADYEIGDKFSNELKSGGKGPAMVVIPSGRFTLGGGSPGQHNLGTIKIEYRLAFGATEVTLGQYRQFLKSIRSARLDKLPKGNDELPVSGVSWDEAESYVTWLSRETGNHYRLPSASEWEYAARAGTSVMYFWGDEIGENKANCLNCGAGFDGALAPAGSFAPNAWGLFDMHGNVWEWAKDCIDSNSAPPVNGMPKLFGNCDMRELRGGSASSDGWSIRAGARASALRSTKNPDVGFRVVMEIPRDRD
jgi:formylglycine-generating enzyme required for sulfatase activity